MSNLKSREQLHALVDELDDSQITHVRLFLEFLKHGEYHHTDNRPSAEKHYLPTPPPIRHQDAFGAHVETPDND